MFTHPSVANARRRFIVDIAWYSCGLPFLRVIFFTDKTKIKELHSHFLLYYNIYFRTQMPKYVDMIWYWIMIIPFLLLRFKFTSWASAWSRPPNILLRQSYLCQKPWSISCSFDPKRPFQIWCSPQQSCGIPPVYKGRHTQSHESNFKCVRSNYQLCMCM